MVIPADRLSNHLWIRQFVWLAVPGILGQTILAAFALAPRGRSFFS
jgi:hypothetical protein